jgi:hypothetical protein
MPMNLLKEGSIGSELPRRAVVYDAVGKKFFKVLG